MKSSILNFIIIGSHTGTVFALREGTQQIYCCSFNSIISLVVHGHLNISWTLFSRKLQMLNIGVTPVVDAVVACRDGADRCNM